KSFKKAKPHGPRIGIGIVVDQFAYHHLQRVRPHLKGGLKKLLDDGIFFENASFPHGRPSTSTGHAGISTGAYAQAHGIVDNRWTDETGKIIESIEDGNESGVFALDGKTYDFGASSKNLVTDTFSDQFMLSQKPGQSTKVFAFSLKDRSAILLAGKRGKALWMDSNNGLLTSSKAYFEKLPDWVKKFNISHAIRRGMTFEYKYPHPLDSPAYNFRDATNYKFSLLGKTIIGKKITVPFKSPHAYSEIRATNYVDRFVFKAAKQCIEENFTDGQDDKLFIWLSLSALDFAGHMFGPDSREAANIIYHIDEELDKLIQLVHSKVSPAKSLFLLTGDHGVMPIPEVLAAAGLTNAHRITSGDVVKHMNEIAEKESSIKELVKLFSTPFFYFNDVEFNKLKDTMRESVYQKLIGYLESLPGVRRVLTREEMEKITDVEDPHVLLLKKQHYRGRGADLTCVVDPHFLLTPYSTGTSHATPYFYDRHVPLVVWQRGVREKQIHSQPVSMLQVAGSLAHAFGVPKPSASEEPLLPGFYTAAG
ncbi:hypothetical protein HOD08_05425, partial [bacterium]|nr:hypothetical protein [bacterium]